MIDERNFIQLALKSYDNPSCISVSEFEQDLNRFQLIKSFIQKYKSGSSELRERLILNHLVICYNVFGNSATKFLLYKIPKDQWDVLFPFIVFLERMPEKIDELNPSDISLDQHVVKMLRQI